MRTRQRKVGLRVVIEIRCQPIVGCVAVTARLAQRALVDVVFSMAANAHCFGIVEAIRLMAVTARNGSVHSHQRERCEVVVESNVRVPLGFRVAVAAILTELTGMAVVELMTAATRQRQFDRNLFLVARNTFHFRMLRMQLKVGVAVIEQRVAPFRRLMTLGTIITVSTLMVVFVQVAARTLAGQIVLKVFSGMTVLTVQATVPIGKREPCLSQVIEPHCLPGGRRMALLARGAVTARMDVVDRMTTRTLRRGSGKLVAAMAIDALDVAMLSRQGIADVRMIERCAGPGGLAVAVGTRVAKLSVVNVVVTMTPDAVCGRIAVLLSFDMTTAAHRREVCAVQGKVAEVMVEDAGADGHDVGVTPFVIGMANDALAISCRRERAVKSSLFRSVLPNIVMTLYAEDRLRQLGVDVVTSGAVTLNVRVPRDDSTGHHELLNLGERGGTGDRSQHSGYR